MADSASTSPGSQSEIDTTRAHTARIWNYWLGGRDNYPIDCEVGDQIRQFHPDIGNYARADRLFLGRAVQYLAGEAGIRQFLDIGTGLPTVDNTHEVAQRVAPESRIVYVDNDPLVLVHARAPLRQLPGAVPHHHQPDDARRRRRRRVLERARHTEADPAHPRTGPPVF